MSVLCGCKGGRHQRNDTFRSFAFCEQLFFNRGGTHPPNNGMNVRATHASRTKIATANRRVPELFRLHRVWTIPCESVVGHGISGLGYVASFVFVVTAFLLLTAVSDRVGTPTSMSFATPVGFVVSGFILVNYVILTAVEVLMSAMRAVYVCHLQVCNGCVEDSLLSVVSSVPCHVFRLSLCLSQGLVCT